MFAVKFLGADAPHVDALSRASQIGSEFEEIYSYPRPYIITKCLLIFLISGVRLESFGTAATTGLFVPAPDDR
jgi:hypothetical protein